MLNNSLTAVFGHYLRYSENPQSVEHKHSSLSLRFSPLLTKPVRILKISLSIDVCVSLYWPELFLSAVYIGGSNDSDSSWFIL